jgi:ABC-type branched-subunit amino acid transport system ATPase component
MIRAVLPVGHAYADERREQEIRALLTRLAAGRFQLAVIGQSGRGKTTLMNALPGEAYLPMGALAMTSALTTVRYGTRVRALVRSHAAALPVEVPVTDVARASAERTRMQVSSVEVEIPAELLRLGLEFVDTPAGHQPSPSRRAHTPNRRRSAETPAWLEKAAMSPRASDRQHSTSASSIARAAAGPRPPVPPFSIS